jgi:hypothetical protein
VAREVKVKKFIALIILVLTVCAFCAERQAPVKRDMRKFIMTDAEGMPLDDGFYNVEFRIYDRNKDGRLISSHSAVIESSDGVCAICEEKLYELEAKGYTEVWISLKIENYPETKHRTRVFIDRLR